MPRAATLTTMPNAQGKLTPAERGKIKKFAASRTQEEGARLLGIARPTLRAILLGGEVSSGTAALVRSNLSRASAGASS